MKQRNIISLLRKEFGHHEVTVFSASTKNRAGVLDCEIAYRGGSIWIEIKINNDTLKPTQLKFMERHNDSSFCLHYYDFYYSCKNFFILYKYDLTTNMKKIIEQNSNFDNIIHYMLLTII